jgi:hypothetical protein
MLTIGRGRSIPANRAQIGGEYLRVIGPRIVEDSLMAVRDNRAIELVVPEHFKCLALGVVVDASEPRANECLSAVYALNKPMPRAAVATATPQAIALIRRQDSGRALEDVAGALRIAGSSAEMFGGGLATRLQPWRGAPLFRHLRERCRSANGWSELERTIMPSSASVPGPGDFVEVRSERTLA